MGFEKVQQVYAELRPLYARGRRDGIGKRKIIAKKLVSMLGERYTVVSDDTNNTVDILDMSCFVARVWWKENPAYSEFKYVNLVFGPEENAIKVAKSLW